MAVPTSRWRETLCVREERAVGNDNTEKWNGRTLDLPPSSLRPHFAKATVRIHEYWDGALSVWLGPHRLGEYGADGARRDCAKQGKAAPHRSTRPAGTKVTPGKAPRGDRRRRRLPLPQEAARRASAAGRIAPGTNIAHSVERPGMLRIPKAYWD